MLKTIQVILVVLGILLALGGNQLDMPLLVNAAVACFGLAALVTGIDAILTQQVVIGSRRRGSKTTYVGIPAVIHGVQYSMFGFLFVGMALMMQLDADAQSVVQQAAQRPGLPLIALGMILLLQAAIRFTAPYGISDRTYSGGMANLILMSWLPGAILVLVGLAITGLGLFEFVAPDTFDAMGGGLLETLYGVK